MNLRFYLILILVLVSRMGYSQCGPLATAYNQNNGQDGIMFDVVALNSVEITNFDINCGNATHDFEIYYRPGTHVGFENNAAGWNLIGTANGVNGPINVPTPIPAFFSVVLCAGDVGAFYVTSTGAGSIDYTNGTGVGNVLAADANLQLLEGTGKDYAFAASFTPRSPNITVHYNCLSLSCCAVQAINYTLSACVANQYSTSGTIDVMNPPSTGTLTVEDCNGNQDVINAPFTNPINFNITGQTANGGPCTITATFSDDPSCTLTENYTAPASCTTCSIDNLTVNVGACNNADNLYNVDGTVAFTDPPSTGTLIIEIDNGTTVVDTIINGPFTSPYTWSISGNNSDNSACVVTAYFSDDPGCTNTFNYTAPYPCQCIAEVGNFTPVITGQSTNNYVLCYGDDLTILSNMDNLDPYEMFNPPGPAYDPGIGWAMYSCPPTVALTPSATNVLADDPCFLGFFTMGNFNDLNDGSTIGAYPAGTFTNNTVYFMPVTMYSMSGSAESYVNSGLPCYETGPVYAVQYLEDFSFSVTEDCQTGTAAVTVNGSDPQMNGTNFTASNLAPSNASFGNTTAGNSGVIQVTGLQSNNNYSFDVTDVNGCTFQVTAGPFPLVEDPAFNYSAASYCQDAGLITPTITGTSGGTFSASPAGLSINTNSGEIDPATSVPGTYDITYTTPDPLCFASSTVTVEIIAVPVVNAGTDDVICIGEAATLNASGAQTYVWSNGLTNGDTFYPDSSATYIVTGSNGICSTDDSVYIEVLPLPSLTITPDTSVAHDGFIQLNAGGGVTYSWDPSDYLSCDDCSNPIATPVQNTLYCVTVTDDNGCVNESCTMIEVIIECGEVFVPSGFSPNDDGENDYLCLYSNCWDRLTLTIFNRWGEKVFESSSETICWDGTWNGTPLNPAVFVYKVDGYLINGQAISQKGNITLMR